MSTYIFLWNPTEWPWLERRDALQSCAVSGSTVSRWSIRCHRLLQKDLEQSSTVKALLIRTGKPKDQQGLIGWGQINALPFAGPHYNELRANEGKTLFYVDILFQHLYAASPISRSTLARLAPATFSHLPRSSGQRVDAMDAEAVWSKIGQLRSC